MIRRVLRRLGRWIGPGGFGLLLALSAGPVFGQIPEPRVPEIEKRSGLLQRFDEIEGNLPVDPRRQSWYHTRWAMPPNRRPFINWYKNGGMYGLRWKPVATESVYPFFFGSPGKSTLRPEHHRIHPRVRWIDNWVHPFRPVGEYYDQGSYVPIYDLDPLVPGPGPMPWPWYYKGGFGIQG